jgi:DNA primase (bacterial type)
MTATCDSPLEVAKERLRIPALWVILALPGKPEGSCGSPFREDRNPSFAIFDHDRRFYDHGTGQGGDAMDFLAMALGISNGDASRKLIELAGVIPQTPDFQREEKHGSGDQMAEKARKRKSWPTFDAPKSAEIKAIAELRGLSIEGVSLAAEAGLLWCVNCDEGRAWIVTDSRRLNAQARRMDCKAWAKQNVDCLDDKPSLRPAPAERKSYHPPYAGRLTVRLVEELRELVVLMATAAPLLRQRDTLRSEQSRPRGQAGKP